jgi:hypothetical protein
MNGTARAKVPRLGEFDAFPYKYSCMKSTIETRERWNAYYKYRTGKNPDYRYIKKSRVGAVTDVKVKDYHRIVLLNNIRTKCRCNNIPFNLTLDDIVIPETCPVLGIPLQRGEGYRSDNSPSLDRINPTGGYVKGNVLIVSMRVNTMKNNGTWQELLKIAEFYRDLKTG